jgi:hypothetical protein
MAWKKYTLQEPPNDGAAIVGRPIDSQLDQIEAEGYEIKFVFKESARYTVLARKKAH